MDQDEEDDHPDGGDGEGERGNEVLHQKLLPLGGGDWVRTRHVAAGTHASGVAVHTTEPGRAEVRAGPVDAGRDEVSGQTR